MPVRTGHTATLLQNGKVLVAGGQTGERQESLTDAALYDPAAGTWQTTAPMATARTAHTATLLASGKVLVLGGFDRRRQKVTFSNPSDPNTAQVRPAFVNEVEVFDPVSGKWTTTSPMPSCGSSPGLVDAGRMSHTATLLQTGKVLVAGGQCGGHDLLALKDALLFDAAKGRWQATAPMEVGRRQHTASLLTDGTVLVAGGYSVDGTPHRDAAVYEPSEAAWTPRVLKSPRGEHTATLLEDGTVFMVGGGRDAEIYDPRTRTAVLTTSLEQPRWGHTAALLPGGAVLIVGGRGDGPEDPAPDILATAELYDPSVRRWTSAGSTIKKGYAYRPEGGLPPAHNTATLLSAPPCGPNCGKVLLVGGAAEAGSAELYAPAPRPGSGETMATGSAPEPGENTAGRHDVAGGQQSPAGVQNSGARGASTGKGSNNPVGPGQAGAGSDREAAAAGDGHDDVASGVAPGSEGGEKERSSPFPWPVAGVGLLGLSSLAALVARRRRRTVSSVQS